MSDDTFLAFIRTAQILAYTVAYLVSAAAVFFMFQQPKLKAWFDETGELTQVIGFIILSTLLAQPVETIIAKLFSFVIALVQSHDEFIASVQCLSGLLIFGTLVAGSWLLLRQVTKPIVD